MNQALFARDIDLKKSDVHRIVWRELGYSPIIPEQLNALAYQPFIAILRSAMRFAGGMSLEDALEF
ncbi:hypothetical protein ABTD05_19440, partial [Acinetobacter baumannii]